MKTQNKKSKEGSARGGNYGITNKVKQRVLSIYEKEFGRHKTNVKRDSE